MNTFKKLYKDFFGYRLNEAANVPDNVMKFAKRKGPDVVALVKQAASWADKAGKYISGGTAIGKDYNTIVLDMKHQGGEIHINLDNETIELFGEPVTDANSFARVLADLSEAKITVDTKNPAAIKAAQEMAKNDPATELHFEEVNAELDEAQLINHITDYQGGVEYVLRNPAEAKQVSEEIRSWAEKKGFVVLKQTMSNNGKIGYFYFKLGQDTALESQRIQGYIAQKPEIKHFRFNVKGQKKIQPRRENPSM